MPFCLHERSQHFADTSSIHNQNTTHPAHGKHFVFTSAKVFLPKLQMAAASQMAAALIMTGDHPNPKKKEEAMHDLHQTREALETKMDGLRRHLYYIFFLYILYMYTIYYIYTIHATPDA